MQEFGVLKARYRDAGLMTDVAARRTDMEMPGSQRGTPAKNASPDDYSVGDTSIPLTDIGAAHS